MYPVRLSSDLSSNMLFRSWCQCSRSYLFCSFSA